MVLFFAHEIRDLRRYGNQYLSGCRNGIDPAQFRKYADTDIRISVFPYIMIARRRSPRTSTLAIVTANLKADCQTQKSALHIVRERSIAATPVLVPMAKMSRSFRWAVLMGLPSPTPPNRNTAELRIYGHTDVLTYSRREVTTNEAGPTASHSTGSPGAHRPTTERPQTLRRDHTHHPAGR
jgi:hypothetical protein